jgi:hypothetical protein
MNYSVVIERAGSNFSAYVPDLPCARRYAAIINRVGLSPPDLAKAPG